MEPFNLQAALEGKPLVTRDGAVAKFIGLLEGITLYPIVCELYDYEGKSKVLFYSEKGTFDHTDCCSGLDLFMAP